MKTSRAILAVVGLLIGAAPLTASGPMGALYRTNAGIVKLSETGNHADIVRQLKDALKAR